MQFMEPGALDWSESWIDGDATARWRSATGHAADASGSSLLEVAPGCRLPRHTDSAEEAIVLTEGVADVSVGEERATLSAGGLAVVPADVPHEVRNAGGGPLRFVALYAANDVTTRYEAVVQPDGSRERHTVSPSS
jgi:quercetin dioxygenase-like cupin family protein